MKRLTLLWISMVLVFPAWGEVPLKLGMLAYRPKEVLVRQWQPMADYLSKAMGRTVEITPYNFDEFNAAIPKGLVDVVFTNPGHFIPDLH